MAIVSLHVTHVCSHSRWLTKCRCCLCRLALLTPYAQLRVGLTWICLQTRSASKSKLFAATQHQCGRLDYAIYLSILFRIIAESMTKGSGKGKNKNAKLEVRPFMVKNYLWVFVNSMINNPTFDSQVYTQLPLKLSHVCCMFLQAAWRCMHVFGSSGGPVEAL